MLVYGSRCDVCGMLKLASPFVSPCLDISRIHKICTIRAPCEIGPAPAVPGARAVFILSSMV